jgi:Phage integrase, N-terminal SAM-like domain
MSETPVSDFRRRMLEDMAVRKFGEKSRQDYIRHVAMFAKFLGRSPVTATAEDVRRYQVHLTESGVQPPTLNSSASALRFFFATPLDRAELARLLARVHSPRKLPRVLSPEEVGRLLEAQNLASRDVPCASNHRAAQDWRLSQRPPQARASSAWRRGVPHDHLGHLQIVGPSSLVEAFNDACAILDLSILAHLPLALDARDRKAKANDAAQHSLNVGLGRIRQRPWPGLFRLLLHCKLVYVAAQPALVVHYHGPTISMHDSVVPGRNNFLMVGFGEIPVGCDVPLHPMENHQRLAAFSKVLPMRVGSRQMAFDHPISRVVFEYSRQMGSEEAERARGHQCRKRTVAN